MKIKASISFFLLLILAASCEQEADESKTVLPETMVQEIFFVSENGDTITTGVAIPAGKPSVNVASPLLISNENPKNTGVNSNAHTALSPTIAIVSKELKSYRASAPIITTAKNKKVQVLQPHPVNALSARYKDAANINLQYMDTDNGMNSSYIRTMIEDSKGNIWFGTDGGGAGRYDGNTFTNYTEKEGLSNNAVWDIIEDSKGNIWFATEGGGVCKYNGENFIHYTKKDGLSSDQVWSLLEDKNGNIWIGTNGGGVNKFDGKTFENYTMKEGLPHDLVVCLAQDKKGNIWMGTYNGACKFDGQNFTTYTTKEGLGDNRIYSIMEDKKGNLWFGTYEGGVSKFDGNSIASYTTKQGLNHDIVYSVLEDNKGQLWFATYGGGVTRFDGKTFTHYTEQEGLSSNYVTTMMEDSQGKLWFGTYGGGLCRYDEGSFIHFTEKEGLANSRVYSILKTKKGTLWMGTDGGGASIFNGNSFNTYSGNENQGSSHVRSLLEDSKGNIWMGTHHQGVIKYDGNSFSQFSEKQGLSNNRVYDILEDKEGNIWMATYGGGLNKYDGKTFTQYTEKEGLISNKIYCFTQDHTGVLWIGSAAGLTKFDGKTFTHYTQKEGLKNHIVRCITIDSKGLLWLGTEGGGLHSFNGKTFTVYSEKNGLCNNIISSIIEDKQHNIWISTEKGISVLLLENAGNYKIISYGKKDGLKSVDFYLNSVCLDNENRLWWGSGKSLTMLDLKLFKLNNHAPKIMLGNIELEQEFVDYRRLNDTTYRKIFAFGDDLNGSFDSVVAFYNYPDYLDLLYNINHLTFNYSAIDWSANHKIKYQFMLQGFDAGWNPLSEENKADYRNIPFGQYTFKVRAMGESQLWSEPFEYHFSIHPPWWRTWWAHLSYIVFFIFILILLIRWRTQQLKEKQKELHKIIEERTAEVVEKKEEIQNQYQLLSNSHKEIRDSINYAKRIQQAMLPKKMHLDELFNEYCVVFQPKDIVSGDFYFAEKRNNKSIFAVADCTGHGVPGALMSVLCSNLLSKTVKDMSISNPGEILDMVTVLLMQRFQDSSENVNDGMDVALCCLHHDSMVLEYAGANNPLLIVRNNSPILITADKQAVGVNYFKDSFTTHTIQLQKGDVIYLASDGFADQFGGPYGKKMKTKAFREFLISISDNDLLSQQILIEEEFKEWRGNYEQLDDVCVMGIRV